MTEVNRNDLSATELVHTGYDLDNGAMESARRAGQDMKLMALTLIWGHGFCDDQVGEANGPGGHLFRVANWTVKTHESGVAGYVRHEDAREAQSRLDNHPVNVQERDGLDLDGEREWTLEVTIKSDRPLLDIIAEVHERLAQVGGNWSVEDVMGVDGSGREYACQDADDADTLRYLSDPEVTILKGADDLVDVGDMMTSDGVGRPPIPVGQPIRARIGAPVPAGRPPVEGPSDLECAMMERQSMDLVPFGPLTFGEHDQLESYHRHCAEAEAEYQREQAHGGRELCPNGCGYTVNKSVVNPADPTVMRHCPSCDYREL